MQKIEIFICPNWKKKTLKKKLDRNKDYLIDYISAKLRGTKIEWVLKYIQIRANFLFVLIKKKTFQKQLLPNGSNWVGFEILKASKNR